MDITPLIPRGRQLINGYGDGGFTVSGVRVEGSVIVFPERTIAWPVVDWAAFAEESIAEIMEHPGLELLLIGTGRAFGTVSPELRQAFRTRGIGLEVMDTGAACRTYNVLLAEGRPLVAALIAV